MAVWEGESRVKKLEVFMSVWIESLRRRGGKNACEKRKNSLKHHFKKDR